MYFSKSTPVEAAIITMRPKLKPHLMKIENLFILHHFVSLKSGTLKNKSVELHSLKNLVLVLLIKQNHLQASDRGLPALRP